MPALQLFLTGCFIIAFLTLLMIVAWYAIVPLIVLGGFAFLSERVKRWHRHRQIQHLSNGCTLRQTPEHMNTGTVIDVDYTELE